MQTLADIKKQVRAIVGDSAIDWTDDAYITPIINHCYELICIYLSDTCSPYITKVELVPLLPIGTTDLSQYQNQTGQPLYGLINPTNIYWKPAGSAPNYFREATQRDIVPNATPGYPPPVNCLFWEWRSFVIYLTPLAYLIDLQVRGEFRPAPLLNDDDRVQLHPLLGPALAEEAASYAMRERANTGQMQAYELSGINALDNIANQLVRSQQGTTVRLGRARGRSRGRGGYGYGGY